MGVRRKGAGRHAVEEADPGLVRALQALVEPESRGYPQFAAAVDDQVHVASGR